MDSVPHTPWVLSMQSFESLFWKQLYNEFKFKYPGETLKIYVEVHTT